MGRIAGSSTDPRRADLVAENRILNRAVGSSNPPARNTVLSVPTQACARIFFEEHGDLGSHRREITAQLILTTEKDTPNGKFTCHGAKISRTNQ